MGGGNVSQDQTSIICIDLKSFYASVECVERGPGIWASEQGFSSGSICLVLASHGYSEDDYIRDYDEFIQYLNEKKNK